MRCSCDCKVINEIVILKNEQLKLRYEPWGSFNDYQK